MEKNIDDLHKEVPGNYYHFGIKHNIFQKFWHEKRFQEVGKVVATIPSKKMLDIGCHGGKFTFEMSILIPGAKIYGIDISSQAISYAKKTYPKFSFRTGRAEKLPYSPNNFDLVTCLEVLEHVETPTLVIKEVRRVLKNGEHFVVLVPSENWLFKLIWFFWIRFGPGRIWHHTHLQKFNGRRLENMLKKEGFQIIKKKTCLLDMLLLIDAKKLGATRKNR
ncbi:hypothetical protein A2Y99_02830 [Candidatus Gottesmanbacteria bacterium RBG_13_37_7]|uniref:Methyltransferase domain-containing protein n=1 Tax=Candidatus Gottesmanbacteria bacterium RBG_13_37_7 TaxID=1798369 RepID=A0A1F5YH88_9BACT|nr:MAG: hypothetical protein A2Y99_02830 [Candidatus Gottesmanbacteria bacterium RBG_13_37_7]